MFNVSVCFYIETDVWYHRRRVRCGSSCAWSRRRCARVPPSWTRRRSYACHIYIGRRRNTGRPIRGVWHFRSQRCTFEVKTFIFEVKHKCSQRTSCQISQFSLECCEILKIRQYFRMYQSKSADLQRHWLKKVCSKGRYGALRHPVHAERLHRDTGARVRPRGQGPSVPPSLSSEMGYINQN